MGHAGAIISGGEGTAAEKMKAMTEAGITVVKSPAEIGEAMARVLGEGLACETRNRSNNKSKDEIQGFFAALRMTTSD